MAFISMMEKRSGMGGVPLHLALVETQSILLRTWVHNGKANRSFSMLKRGDRKPQSRQNCSNLHFRAPKPSWSAAVSGCKLRTLFNTSCGGAGGGGGRGNELGNKAIKPSLSRLAARHLGASPVRSI